RGRRGRGFARRPRWVPRVGGAVVDREVDPDRGVGGRGDRGRAGRGRADRGRPPDLDLTRTAPAQRPRSGGVDGPTFARSQAFMGLDASRNDTTRSFARFVPSHAPAPQSFHVIRPLYLRSSIRT